MRRRVKICLAILFIILLMPVVAFVMLYNSAWAKEIDDEYISTSSGWNELKIQGMKDCLIAAYMNEGDAVFEFSFDVEKITGCVNVTIYGGNAKIEDDEYKNIMNPEHEIASFQLTETGTKTYCISDIKYSCYVAYWELTEDSEYANIQSKTFTWITNWESLLGKLGIHRDEKNGIDTIRTVVE